MDKETKKPVLQDGKSDRREKADPGYRFRRTSDEIYV